jgi:hypothetical protein
MVRIRRTYEEVKERSSKLKLQGKTMGKTEGKLTSMKRVVRGGVLRVREDAMPTRTEGRRRRRAAKTDPLRLQATVHRFSLWESLDRRPEMQQMDVGSKGDQSQVVGRAGGLNRVD